MDNINLDDISFSIVNKDGLEVVCDLLSSYYDDVNDKLYFSFTDYTLTNDNKFNSYIVEAKKNQNGYDLIEINDDEIRNRLIEDTLERIA
jgi:uncharacterized protein YrzB (UPF0473 family)